MVYKGKSYLDGSFGEVSYFRKLPYVSDKEELLPVRESNRNRRLAVIPSQYVPWNGGPGGVPKLKQQPIC